MSHPELFVLRHGETEWNVENRLQGALDSPLTARGLRQARRQAAILKEVGMVAPIYSSPQGRALETAQIVASVTAGQILIVPALSEVTMGDWDGKLVADVAPAEPADALLWKFAAPNGERLPQMQDRVSGFLHALEGPAVLVTHGITSRVLRALVLGVAESGLAEMPGGQGVVFHLKDGVQQKLT